MQPKLLCDVVRWIQTSKLLKVNFLWMGRELIVLEMCWNIFEITLFINSWNTLV